MTIKLEQETILRVLEQPPQLQRRPTQSDSSELQISSPSSSRGLCCSLSLVDIGKSSSPVEDVPGLTAAEDDDTLSTSSLSSDEETFERRVSFCEDVVTEIWLRPFTEKDDIPNLYYSSEDTARFRQEYRLEKKLLSEGIMEPEASLDAGDKDLSSEFLSFSQSQNNAYRISRVVVLHNDKLETFIDQQKEANMDGFFDNDSFWSGSITWY
ncbi:hypothetical protein ACA910_000895 [Epithemia clementina (nom. ined.)]